MIAKALLTVATVLACSPAMATGGYVEPTQKSVLAPAAKPAIDRFDGFYAGLALGQVDGNGTQTFGLVGGGSVTTPIDLDRDTTPGLFAGYNMQSGALVYGVKIAAWSTDAPFNAAQELSKLTDVSARLGWVSGRALFYGSLGWSWATQENVFNGFEVDMDGVSFGLGVEYNVTDRFFLGAEYTARNLDGSQGAYGLDIDVDTLSIQAGFRF